MKCIHPTVINCDGTKRLVPCGRCAWCRKKKRDEWFVRFLAQSMKQPCFFLTLTYSDDCIPTRFVDLETGVTYIVRGMNDDLISDSIARIGSVPVLEDFQKYIKRVRKNFGRNFPIKYFFVSEYGSRFGRLHYHALIWCDHPDICYYLLKEWPFGDVVCDNASEGAMKYITKYILKGSSKKSNGLRDDNIKSNSNGIGDSLWPELISKYISSNYNSVFKWFGSYHAFPAYYKKKIRDELDLRDGSVEIELFRQSDGSFRAKNKHGKTVQALDDSRELPEIKEHDLIHQLLRLKIKDLPLYIQELYMRDYNKQVEINTKINPNFNQ